MKKIIPHYLYVLEDPFTYKIRYVGITSNIKERLRIHFYAHGNTLYKSNPELYDWVFSLKNKNAHATTRVIKKYPDYESAHRAEVLLISRVKDGLFNKNHKSHV